MSKKSIIITILLIAVIAPLVIVSCQLIFNDLAVGKRYLKYFYYEGAMEKFQSILNRDPDNAEAHLYLGLAYGKRRNYEGFLQEMRWLENKGAEVKIPAEVENDIGMVYYLLEMYPQAIKEFKKATQINLGYGEAQFNLAAAYAANSQNEEAIVAYRKVLEIEPQNVYAHWNLAVIFENTGRIEEAIEHWQKYLEFVPGMLRKPEAEMHLRDLQERFEKLNKKGIK